MYASVESKFGNANFLCGSFIRVAPVNICITFFLISSLVAHHYNDCERNFVEKLRNLWIDLDCNGKFVFWKSGLSQKGLLWNL